MRNLSQYENRDYQFTLAAMKKRYRANKTAMDTLRESADGLTMKEAQTSADLAGFLPDLFTPELIRVGDLEALARNIFPTETQSSQDEFKTRLKYRTDGAGVAREGDELKQSRSSRETDTNTFVKLYDFPISTWERVQDSLLNETADDISLGLSRIYRRENQLMSHALVAGSQGEKRERWSNYRNVAGSGWDLDSLKIAMSQAYVNLTSRLQDRVAPSQLRWLFSPSVFALLFDDESTRRYDVLGTAPTQVTGSIPAPYGVPFSVIETGYFDTESVWNPTHDVFLIAPALAATNRDRVSLRIESFSDIRNQTVGPCMWERYSFYVKRYFMYERIGDSENYESILTGLKNLKIDPNTDSDVATIDD